LSSEPCEKRLGPHLLLQALGPCLVKPLRFRVEQIEPQGLSLPLPQPGGHPRAPRPVAAGLRSALQEETARRRLEESPENRQKRCRSGDYAAISACVGLSEASRPARLKALALGSSRSLVELIQKLSAVLVQSVKVALDSTQDDAMAHVEVLMSEQVAEIDDPATFGLSTASLMAAAASRTSPR
jgi:hypothetical protein